MATFAHDPSRVHPPAGAAGGGKPSVAEEERVVPPTTELNQGADTVANPAQESSVADTPGATPREPDAPRTLSIYSDTQTLVSVSLGGSGEPHRIVYMFTAPNYRNQGFMRAAMATVIADMDADGRDSVVFIVNVDPGTEIPRLITLFESLGYAQTTLDPNIQCPQLSRAHQ